MRKRLSRLLFSTQIRSMRVNFDMTIVWVLLYSHAVFYTGVHSFIDLRAPCSAVSDCIVAASV